MFAMMSLNTATLPSMLNSYQVSSNITSIPYSSLLDSMHFLALEPPLRKLIAKLDSVMFHVNLKKNFHCAVSNPINEVGFALRRWYSIGSRY